jgi:hypothetical protein
MTTWEYKFELESAWTKEGKSQEQRLNELGKEGWELVTVAYIPVHGPSDVSYIFKKSLSGTGSDFNQQPFQM